MAASFFFYDLETSGLNPRQDRVMQFAGQRTDMDLRPIGDPVNVLVRLSDDTLPSPEATLVTGITPQQTVQEGLTEAEFCKLLQAEIFTPDTIVTGFNNIRFDDEFIRHLFWRNFYDPYEWTYKDGRSRWDLLDVVRMTRALRPEGIEWPMADGVPVNKLERIAAANGLTHTKAHDALSDVEALIQVTQLIKQKQPGLYDYLFKMRDKTEIKKLINLDDKRPFVYSSGRYQAEYNKTTVAFPLTSGKNGNIVVYDLRCDPADFIALNDAELKKRLYASYEDRIKEDFVPIPVKELQYNRAPAVAPLGVLTQYNGWDNLKIDSKIIERNVQLLLNNPSFAEAIRTAYEQRADYPRATNPEEQLYDGFLNDGDRVRLEAVRNATAQQLADFHPEFVDERLAGLLLHYKARSHPATLSEDEAMQWEEWRAEHVQAQLPEFIAALQRCIQAGTDDSSQFILQELQLWAESIMPEPNY